MHFKIEKLLLDTFLLFDYPKLGCRRLLYFMNRSKWEYTKWGILKQIVLKNEGLGPTSKVHKFLPIHLFFCAVQWKHLYANLHLLNGIYWHGRYDKLCGEYPFLNRFLGDSLMFSAAFTCSWLADVRISLLTHTILEESFEPEVFDSLKWQTLWSSAFGVSHWKWDI